MGVCVGASRRHGDDGDGDDDRVSNPTTADTLCEGMICERQPCGGCVVLLEGWTTLSRTLLYNVYMLDAGCWMLGPSGLFCFVPGRFRRKERSSLEEAIPWMNSTQARPSGDAGSLSLDRWWLFFLVRLNSSRTRCGGGKTTFVSLAAPTM